MIHLNTNYLLGALTSSSSEQNQVITWLRSGETVAASAIVWSEFLTGPVSAQEIEDAQGLLQGRIIPFDEKEAHTAAKLFNLIGRKRAMRTDCFVAATAISAGALLATLNRKDFVLFTPMGLRLA